MNVECSVLNDISHIHHWPESFCTRKLCRRMKFKNNIHSIPTVSFSLGVFSLFFFFCVVCVLFPSTDPPTDTAYLSLPSKWFFAQKCRPNRGKAADILHSFFPLLPFLHHLHLLLQSFFSHCIRMFGFENRRKWKHLWQSGNFVLFAFVIDNNKFDQK